MAKKKIDYSKVEQHLAEALIRMQVDQLTHGKPTASQRSKDYYGLDDTTPRPVREDPVERLIEEGLVEKPGVEQVEIEDFSSTPDKIQQSTQRRSAPPQLPIPLPKAPSKEMVEEPISDLLLLRRHIFWMKQQGIQDRYEQLGTSMPEIFALRRKSRLSDEDKLRIQALLKKARAIRESIMEQKGTVSDEMLIESEQKKHKTKRLNVREKWLQLCSSSLNRGLSLRRSLIVEIMLIAYALSSSVWPT